jgi:hypothetical protein
MQKFAVQRLHTSPSTTPSAATSSPHNVGDWLTSPNCCFPLQDVMGVDAFTSSEEAFAADTLFNAYR